jgi:hypothetical protein
MSLLDRFRSDPTADLLRDEPVLALPANLASARVAAYAREWAPGAVPAGTGVLELDDTVELHGPVSYDETLWRRAKLPADCAVAYAARLRPAEDADWTDVHVDLIAGLCDRVGGRWRQSARKSWEDPETDLPDPYVYAPRLLAPEEVLGLVVPILPGAVIGGGAEPDCYDIYDGERLVIEVDAQLPTAYPQVKLQPWFASAERLTEYAVVSDGTAQAREQAVRVADAIAEATGGMVLGENGFPWRDR